MTTRKYAGMTKCSSVTASRDLADLVRNNILQKLCKVPIGPLKGNKKLEYRQAKIIFDFH
jgi:predicted HTH transcriptional regulator